MKGKILSLAAITVFFIACSKDKFQTKPQITLKSYNTKVLAPDNDLIITIECTDKEGDLANGNFIYYPKRVNIRPIPSLPNPYSDSIVTPLDAEIPDRKKVDVELRLSHVDLHKGSIENDTLMFNFVVVDAAGNRSDSLQSDKIVILNQ